MRKNFVLIDLENVQPKNLKILASHDFKILVFVGEKQTKVSFELASAMQTLGTKAEYIKINGNGPNALDFHIAFYIGKISENEENCYFHIISKDTGFDPLIRHLKENKIFSQRHKDISDIPLLKISNASSKDEKINSIVEFLISRGNAKPRTLKTLSNSLRALFMKKIEESELKELENELISRKLIIVVNNEKVSYNIKHHKDKYVIRTI